LTNGDRGAKEKPEQKGALTSEGRGRGKRKERVPKKKELGWPAENCHHETMETQMKASFDKNLHQDTEKVDRPQRANEKKENVKGGLNQGLHGTTSRLKAWEKEKSPQQPMGDHGMNLNTQPSDKSKKAPI